MVQGLVRYPGAGCVVEFMQGNAPQIAWVLEEQNGRLRLLLPNRRETALQAARILPWPGPAYEKNCSRDAALEILERHKSRREVANVDPLELWELAQGEVEQAPAQWFAELAMSEPDMDAVAACATHHAGQNHFVQSAEFQVCPSVVATHGRMEAPAGVKAGQQGSAFIRLLWRSIRRKARSPRAGRRIVGPRCPRTAAPHHREPHRSETGRRRTWKLIVKGCPTILHAAHLAQA
ncbi:MAG: hypothetical protein ACLR0N_09545 [Bilophila wadsworthia]